MVGGGGGLEPLGTWQHRSPPRWRRGVWSLGHVAVPVPSLSRDAGFSTTVEHGSL
jgi:hypothetical protein